MHYTSPPLAGLTGQLTYDLFGLGFDLRHTRRCSSLRNCDRLACLPLQRLIGGFGEYVHAPLLETGSVYFRGSMKHLPVLFTASNANCWTTILTACVFAHNFTDAAQRWLTAFAVWLVVTMLQTDFTIPTSSAFGALQCSSVECLKTHNAIELILVFIAWFQLVW